MMKLNRSNLVRLRNWRIEHGILVMLLLLLGIVLIRTAWVCDDAFISFAASANLVEGKGLTFQPDERVQAFSNPLWTLLMAGVYAVTGEVWMSSMLLGIALSLLGLVLLLPRGQESRLRVALIGATVLVSASYVDFSTSGLENSLSHLLVILFAGQFLSPRKDAAWLRNLSLTASLLLLNRPDFLFLVAPAGLYALWTAERKGKWKALAMGLAPVLAWEAFSLIYYGFLLPNTWYAKLGVGEGRWFLLGKGLTYLWDTLRDDPPTAIVIFAGWLTALAGKNRKFQLLTAGAVLYVLAVTAAGGDFMRGRMLTVPFVLSLYLLLRSPLPRWWPAPAAVLLVVGLFLPDCPMWSGPDYHLGRTEKPWELYRNNITDERAMYWKKTGWLAHHREPEHPMRLLERKADEARARDDWQAHPRDIKVVGSIGMKGYVSMPGTHILDEAALAEPLLARLPALETRWWRAGHRPRVIPAGYRERLLDPDQKLQDADLDQYLTRLQLVTRGPVWSAARWRAILGFLTGSHRHWVDRERYRQGIQDHPFPEGGIAGGKIEPGRWCPLRIVFPTATSADSIWFRAESGGELNLEFQKNEHPVARAALKPDTSRSEGKQEWYAYPLPDSLKKAGFDAVVLRPAIFHGELILRDMGLKGGD